MALKKIRYVGPFDEVDIEQGSQIRSVKHGGVIEVPAELAAGDGGLLEQPDNWAEVKPTKRGPKAAPAVSADQPEPGEED